MPSPEISTPPRDSIAVGGGGGTGAVTARGDGDWLRVYDRVVAMLPRVEALAAAGRARLEAVNELQHEFWEARDAYLQQRLLQTEESRMRWEAAYIDLRPSGDDRKFAELQESDFEDLTTSIDVLAAENTEFQIKVKEVKGGMGHSQRAADHEDITRDLKAELWKLKQAYEAVCSEKDKKVSEITAERDFVRDQFKTLERDYADLLSCRKKEATQATEAAQELQQNMEPLQVASEKKDDEIRRLRAQEKAKAAEAKRKLVHENKLQEVHCMTKEIDGEIDKCKDQQPETSPKHKKDLSKTHKRGCSITPALREEAKDYSSKQTIAEYGQPETNQKRKFAAFLSDLREGSKGLAEGGPNAAAAGEREAASSVPSGDEVVKAPLAKRIWRRGYFTLDEEPIKKKFKKKKAPSSSARATGSKASSPARELENERDAPPTASRERVETTREVEPKVVDLDPPTPHQATPPVAPEAEQQEERTTGTAEAMPPIAPSAGADVVMGDATEKATEDFTPSCIFDRNSRLLLGKFSWLRHRVV